MSSQLQKSPLYVQVRDALAADIASGAWKPGAGLPSELDLAREFNVSPGTMRKALDQMEADHLIARKHGRGTFVMDHTSDENVRRFINLRDSGGTRIVTTGELLTQTVLPASSEERTCLQLETPEPVVATKRLRHYEGRPLLVEDRRLVVSRFPGLSTHEVGDYAIIELAQRHRVHLSRATENVTTAAAPPEHAKLLSVEVAAPLLKLDRVLFASDGLPVERRVAFCNLRGDVTYFAEIG